MPFVLETDASGLGIGAILSQQNHPIAYFSKKLTPCMQKKSAYVRELYVVTESVNKFRHYLLGHPFTIKTDQEALKHLCQQTIQTPEQQRWLPKLLGYDFKIEYKLGKENIGADALSRSFFLDFSTIHCTLTDQIQKLQQTDPFCQAKIIELQNNSCLDNKFSWHQKLLWRNNTITVPSNSTLREQILHEYHNTPIGGHTGSLRTYARIAHQFYWTGLLKDVKNFVK